MFGEEPYELVAPQRLAEDPLARRIGAIRLEDRLRQIKTNDDNIARGRLPRSGCNTSTLALLFRRGGVHPIASARSPSGLSLKLCCAPVLPFNCEQTL